MVKESSGTEYDRALFKSIAKHRTLTEADCGRRDIDVELDRCPRITAQERDQPVREHPSRDQSQGDG